MFSDVHIAKVSKVCVCISPSKIRRSMSSVPGRKFEPQRITSG